jgi:hypothetical protein
MTDRNRVAPQYQSMVGNQQAQPKAQGAESPTEQQIDEMQSGERWSLEATMRTYNAGGNENGPVQGDKVDE